MGRLHGQESEEGKEMKPRPQTHKKEKDDQGGVPTIEEVIDAVKILSAQCGNARIRNPNKKTILEFLDHHHPKAFDQWRYEQLKQKTKTD